jgi:hypothetical protein
LESSVNNSTGVKQLGTRMNNESEQPVSGGNSMDWTATGAVGQWIAGIGTLALVGYAILQDYLKRPKLLLSFDNEQDVKSQLNTVGLDPSVLSRWLRVRVKNANRRKAAKNCRAFLIGIEKVGPESKSEDMFPNDVRPLVWTHDPTGKPSARDLLPGVVHWVDIVGTIDGQNALAVQVQPAWSLNTPGDYMFTVQVSAEDADPAVIKIRVHWDGTWQSLNGRVIAA